VNPHDPRETDEDDVTLAKPGDRVSITVKMQFGNKIAFAFRNLTLRGESA
jgi:hypothetical protein